MNRLELLVVAGYVLASLGIGLWIHPGAGLLVFGVGVAWLGIANLRNEAVDAAPEATK